MAKLWSWLGVGREQTRYLQKIQSLEEARVLFLRNIMHELKTPIAKGKLITDMLEESKNKERLIRLFSRLDYLINEFASVERVTSSSVVLNPKPYRLVDVIDAALDILFLDHEEIELIVATEGALVACDFELMSIAFKNLIDNAMKYGQSKPKIIINERKIDFVSIGEAIESLDLSKPFNRSYEASNLGLGLGLYTTQHILTLHHFSLHYTHNNGLNIFTITFGALKEH